MHVTVSNYAILMHLILKLFDFDIKTTFWLKINLRCWHLDTNFVFLSTCYCNNVCQGSAAARINTKFSALASRVATAKGGLDWLRMALAGSNGSLAAECGCSWGLLDSLCKLHSCKPRGISWLLISTHRSEHHFDIRKLRFLFTQSNN